MTFEVDDLLGTVSELRSRGVKFEEYDFPGLQDRRRHRGARRRQGRLVQGQRGQHPLRPRDARGLDKRARRRVKAPGRRVAQQPAVPAPSAGGCCSRATSSPAPPPRHFADDPSGRMTVVRLRPPGGVTCPGAGSCFCFPASSLALFAASSPAALAAYGPLWSQPVTAAAQLVASDAGVTVVWAVADGAGAALVAQRYDRAGEPLGAVPAVLADGIDGLSDWLATGDGAGGVIAAWKAGGVTSVQRFAASGVRSLRPRDGLQRRRRGGAARGPAPRRRRCSSSRTASAASTSGFWRRRRCSPATPCSPTSLRSAKPRAPTPASPSTSGTVAGMSSDALGHLFVLLGGPGRNGVAVQHFAPDLNADPWPAPISPYNPLVGPPPATPQTPVGIVAASSATMAWREGGASRCSASPPPATACGCDLPP